MTQAQPLITDARVEAFTASALRVLGWLLALIVRMAATGRGPRLRQVLSRAERGVENILFLKAVALYGPPPLRKVHPRAAKPGFRRLEGRRRRLFFRGAKVRARKANALTRVIALIDALTRPQRAVAYFLKCICNGLRLGRIAMPDAICADTS